MFAWVQNILLSSECVNTYTTLSFCAMTKCFRVFSTKCSLMQECNGAVCPNAQLRHCTAALNWRRLCNGDHICIKFGVWGLKQRDGYMHFTGRQGAGPLALSIESIAYEQHSTAHSETGHQGAVSSVSTFWPTAQLSFPRLEGCGSACCSVAVGCQLLSTSIITHFT